MAKAQIHLLGSASKYVRMGALIALGHHERYDGKGYPSGLDGDHIQLCARVLEVQRDLQDPASDKGGSV